MKLLENEQEICEVLAAYIQEWGAHNVKVVVPESWRRHGINKVGRVKLIFADEEAVTIIAGTRSSHAVFKRFLCERVM